MALTMLDKTTDRADTTAWLGAIAAEFEAERHNHNGCVAPRLSRKATASGFGSSGWRPASASASIVMCWTISGPVTGGRGRQHVHDGTTVEYSYQPGETRHETYGAGQFKVHDLTNIGDQEMVFMTVEFLDSANKPLAIPETVRAAA